MTALASADISKLAAALQKTAEQAGTTTQQVLVGASGQIMAEMQALAPSKTGNLRQSIGVQVLSDSVVIGPDPAKAPYAIYVELGTKPHVIEAKNKRALVFVSGGQKVFAKKVNHPGTAPQPFIRPAFMDWVDRLGPMAASANVKVFTDAS